MNRTNTKVVLCVALTMLAVVASSRTASAQGYNITSTPDKTQIGGVWYIVPKGAYDAAPLGYGLLTIIYEIGEVVVVNGQDTYPRYTPPLINNVSNLVQTGGNWQAPNKVATSGKKYWVKATMRAVKNGTIMAVDIGTSGYGTVTIP